MLKSIAEVAHELLAFLETLLHPLTKPQKQHVAQVTDALTTTEVDKTLSLGVLCTSVRVQGEAG